LVRLRTIIGCCTPPASDKAIPKASTVRASSSPKRRADAAAAPNTPKIEV
jgi:hypothetical protein